MTGGGETMGRHRPLDDQATGGWLFERPPDDPGGSHDGHPTPPPWVPPRPEKPPGMPTDRYAEDRTTGSQRPFREKEWTEFWPRGQAPAPMAVNPLGMPTQDRPRPPRPSETRRPAEKPRTAVRAMDAASDRYLPALLIAVLAVTLLVIGVVQTVDHRRIADLERHVVQLEQPKTPGS